jgi:hypothetical protein
MLHGDHQPQDRALPERWISREGRSNGRDASGADGYVLPAAPF